MIVRINQIDIAKAELDAGWPAGMQVGGFSAPWSANTKAFELLILSQDEKSQPLTEGFRQQQLRHMIPQAALALAAPGEAGVLRLDGPISERELLPAWRYLTEPDGSGRFVFDDAEKLENPPAAILGSVRIAISWRRLAALCEDAALGLERAVRARLLFADPAFGGKLLDTSDTDDPRWLQLLDACHLVIGTTANLRSLHIYTRDLELAQVKSQIMQRLMSVAQGAPPVPA